MKDCCLCVTRRQPSAWEHIGAEGIVVTWHKETPTHRWTLARHPLGQFGFPATHTDDINRSPTRWITKDWTTKRSFLCCTCVASLPSTGSVLILSPTSWLRGSLWLPKARRKVCWSEDLEGGFLISRLATQSGGSGFWPKQAFVHGLMSARSINPVICFTAAESPGMCFRNIDLCEVKRQPAYVFMWVYLCEFDEKKYSLETVKTQTHRCFSIKGNRIQYFLWQIQFFLHSIWNGVSSNSDYCVFLNLFYLRRNSPLPQWRAPL